MYVYTYTIFKFLIENFSCRTSVSPTVTNATNAHVTNAISLFLPKGLEDQKQHVNILITFTDGTDQHLITGRGLICICFSPLHLGPNKKMHFPLMSAEDVTRQMSMTSTVEDWEQPHSNLAAQWQHAHSGRSLHLDKMYSNRGETHTQQKHKMESPPLRIQNTKGAIARGLRGSAAARQGLWQ